MSEFAAGPAGRIERVRALMVERGYDAMWCATRPTFVGLRA